MDRQPTTQLGQRVKALRQKKRWRQEDLAKATGLRQPVISRIELGRLQQPKTDVLKRLSEALGVGADYLIFGAYKTKGVSASGASVENDDLQRIYGVLSDDSRQQLLAYARFLKEQESRERKGSRR